MSRGVHAPTRHPTCLVQHMRHLSFRLTKPLGWVIPSSPGFPRLPHSNMYGANGLPASPPFSLIPPPPRPQYLQILISHRVSVRGRGLVCGLSQKSASSLLPFLFSLPVLFFFSGRTCRMDEKKGKCSTKPTDGIVLHHAEWAVGARPAQGAVVAGHGHGEEAHGYGAGFDWVEESLAEYVIGGRWDGGEEPFLAMLGWGLCVCGGWFGGWIWGRRRTR